MVMVSICMITYNHQDYIVEALEGVFKQQSDFVIELILSNDCSTDQTHQKITNFLENNTSSNIQIKYFIHTENLGMMPNFKFALEQCKGKYIALCEGDDYWTDPLKLQKQVDFLEANTEYSACFHYTPVVHEGVPEQKGRLFGDHNGKLDFTAEDTITTLSPWHTSSFVFKNTTFEVQVWFNDIVSGDMATFSIIAKYGLIRCIPEAMSVYRKNAGGVTNTSAHKAAAYHKNRIKLMQYLNTFHEFKYQEKAEKVIAYHKKHLTSTSVNPLKALLKKVYKKIKKQLVK